MTRSLVVVPVTYPGFLDHDHHDGPVSLERLCMLKTLFSGKMWTLAIGQHRSLVLVTAALGLARYGIGAFGLQDAYVIPIASKSRD